MGFSKDMEMIFNDSISVDCSGDHTSNCSTNDLFGFVSLHFSERNFEETSSSSCVMIVNFLLTFPSRHQNITGVNNHYLVSNKVGSLNIEDRLMFASH